jgi:pyruvate/2-oxoglutarate/acetoin dehydrogenase E1 component
MNMATAINSALDEILSENQNAVILGEDIGKDGGVFRVTDGLFDKYGPGRVMDTPLAESGIIGVSIGMALAGMLPIPEMQFAGFSYLGFDQLISHAARYRSRTRSVFSVPMIVRMPVGGGVRALEHHSESPETYYSHSGGLIVVEPSSPYDAKGLLIRASHMHDTIIFQEPTMLYRLFKQEVPESSYEVEIGKANKVRDGDDLSIITYGNMVNTVKKVVDKRNLSAEIIDLRTINPIDDEAIIKSVKKTGKALIVHEAQRSFGVGAEVSARIAEEAIFELDAPVMRVAAPSLPYPFPGYEQFYVPNEEKVSRAIDKLLAE